jgi:hypothetical protein
MSKLSRRSFLRGTVGAVAVTVIPLSTPYTAPEETVNRLQVGQEDGPFADSPGIARIRWTKTYDPARLMHSLTGDVLCGEMADSVDPSKVRLEIYEGVRLPTRADHTARMGDENECWVFNLHQSATVEIPRPGTDDDIAFAQELIRNAFRDKTPEYLWGEMALNVAAPPGVKQWHE